MFCVRKNEFLNYYPIFTLCNRTISKVIEYFWRLGENSILGIPSFINKIQTHNWYQFVALHISYMIWCRYFHYFVCVLIIIHEDWIFLAKVILVCNPWGFVCSHLNQFIFSSFPDEHFIPEYPFNNMIITWFLKQKKISQTNILNRS